MIENGAGRRPVCVSKTTFTHPCEGDGATILNVQDAFLQMIPQSDDDGGTKINKDGSESMRGCLVLVGTIINPQSSPLPGPEFPRMDLLKTIGSLQESLEEIHMHAEAALTCDLPNEGEMQIATAFEDIRDAAKKALDALASPSSPLPEGEEEDSAPSAQPQSERTKNPTGQAERNED